MSVPMFTLEDLLPETDAERRAYLDRMEMTSAMCEARIEADMRAEVARCASNASIVRIVRSVTTRRGNLLGVIEGGVR